MACLDYESGTRGIHADVTRSDPISYLKFPFKQGSNYTEFAGGRERKSPILKQSHVYVFCIKSYHPC